MSRHFDRAQEEGGFTIVEVLISAVIVVMLAFATFGVIQTAGRTTAETRHRAQAYALAQADQAALRSLKISDLSNYSATRNANVGGATYSIASTGEYVTDSTGTQTCTGSVRADYIAITSRVTWPSIGSRPAVELKSIVTPPNGTIGGDRGALAVKALNSRSTALSGITVNGTGPDTFADTTDANGCVLFGNLPAGNYTLTPSSSIGVVDKDGNAPKPQTASVVAQSTNTVTLQYDRPGTINATFTTRPAANATPVASTADTVMVFNSGMTTAKRFGTVGTRLSAIAAGPLFPFTSPDTIYPGACTGNNPTGAGVNFTSKSVTVPINGSIAASMQLPALYLTVKSGSSSTVPGTNVANARVTLTDRNCTGVKRTMTTNASGMLADPGLPFSSYDICVDNGTRRQTQANVAVNNLQVGTAVTLYLTGTGSVAGTCP